MEQIKINNKQNSVFVANVIELLKKHSITHETLANDVGVSRPYISLLLNEDRVMSPKMMEKIATELDVSINELLKSEELNTNDYQIHLRGRLSNRASKIAYNNILLEMDNYVLLTKDL